MLLRTSGLYMILSLLFGALCVLGLYHEGYKAISCFGLGTMAVYWFSWTYGVFQAGRPYDRLTDIDIKLAMEEDCITFVTPDGTLSLRYQGFAYLFFLKHYCVLVRHQGNYFFIPAHALSAPAVQFLRQKMEQAKVKLL
jgi:hypothetical protein